MGTGQGRRADVGEWVGVVGEEDVMVDLVLWSVPQYKMTESWCGVRTLKNSSLGRVGPHLPQSNARSRSVFSSMLAVSLAWSAACSGCVP